MALSMTARVIHCHLQPHDNSSSSSSTSGPDQVKIIPQPRPCTLRSYSSPRGGLMKKVMTKMMRRRKRRSFDHQGDDHDHRGDGVLDNYQEEEEGEDELELAPILENMFQSIEGSNFEIITGRLAMIIFAVTMGMEVATGQSILNMVDAQGITEGVIVCFAATTCAVFLAHSSTARKKAGRIFIIGFNALFEALIETILDEPFDDNLN